MIKRMRNNALLIYVAISVLILSLAGLSSAEREKSPDNFTRSIILSQNVVYPGGSIEINLNFEPYSAVFIDPEGIPHELEFNKIKDGYTASLKFDKDVVLGEYMVIADNLSVNFTVDFCELEAFYSENRISGTATCYYTTPAVYYRFEGKEKAEGIVEAENNTFEIHIPDGAKKAFLKCGNSEVELNLMKKKREVSLEELYFPGEIVVIGANFKPEKAFIQNPAGLIFPISFEEKEKGEFVAEFSLEKDIILGNYTVVVDEIVRRFYVDYYTISAEFNGSFIAGSVDYYAIMPEEVCYQAENFEGCVGVDNSTFEIEVPENLTSITLICGNTVEKLERELYNEKKNTVSLDRYSVEVITDKGKIQDLKSYGKKLTIKITGLNQEEEVNVTLRLPFEIPEGLHVYIWNYAGGKPVPLDYVMDDGRGNVTFMLKDGEGDYDNQSDGIINSTLKVTIPKFRAEKNIIGNAGLLKISDEESRKSFDINVEVDKGEITYLAFVDPESLPSKISRFPYGLLRFRIEGLERGEEVTVKIHYKDIGDYLTPDGKARYYKFNPKKVEWDLFNADVDGNTVILKLKDGGFGDDDGEANGVIEDDGGIGTIILKDITLDGDMSDWQDILARTAYKEQVWWDYPYQVDGVPTTDWDNKTIKSTGRDLKRYACTWNDTHYFGFVERDASENNIQTFILYIDTDGDNHCEYNDPVVVIDWQGSNGNVDVELWRYKPRYNDTGDPIVSPITGKADGYSMPGSLNYEKSIAFNKNWGSADGLQMEFGISWSDLGILPPPSGVYSIHMSSSKGEQNLNQIEDNLGPPYGPGFVSTKKIVGRVLEDFYPLGVNEGEDVGIADLEVALFKDLNSNGVIDSDEVLNVTRTNSSGYFNFTVGEVGALYFVAVNSLTVNTTRMLNNGYKINDIWAEETYQTNESNYSQIVPFFGGRSPEISDNWSEGIYEHYVRINSKNYSGEMIDFGFSFDVVVNTKDSDDDPANPRYSQGSLRQFIANSNAIAGEQRSYFVMANPPNSNDSRGNWWTITANASLGPLPAFTDEVELNGTVLNADMTVNNSNPDCMLYNYSTNTLESVACSESIPVGVGSDGAPFSGDEPRLNAIPKPEIEIIGVAGSPVLNFIAKAHVSSVSIFSGSNGMEILGDGSQLDKVFAGLRANGSDPQVSGFSRISDNGIRILSNNTTVSSSIAGFNGLIGIRFEGSGVKSGKASSSIAFTNALENSHYDGFIAVHGAANVIFENCVSANNSGSGIDNYNGGRITIRNCSIVKNGWGNAEPSGIRVSGSGSEIVNNLIAENAGDGILVTPTGSTGTPNNINVSRNSIFRNGYAGIDLNVYDSSNNRGDNVTLNDGFLDCNQPNCGIDYPVIEDALFNSTHLYVKGFINSENANSGSANFAGALVEVYLVKNSSGGDDLAGNNLSMSAILDKHYGEGWVYLGTLQADGNGNFEGWLNIAGKGVENYALISATATISGYGTSEFGPDYLLVKKYGVQAGIKAEWEGGSLNVTVKVHSFENTTDVRVCWFKPSGLSVSEIDGDFDSQFEDGNFICWIYGFMGSGEKREINIKLTPQNEFSISEIYWIGVDPRGVK